MSEHIYQSNPERTPFNTVSANTDMTSFCDEYHRCLEQNRVEFGCVPLSPLRLFTGDPTYWEQIPDILSAHKMIRESGLPNFWVSEFLFIPNLMLKLGGFTCKTIGINRWWTLLSMVFL